MDYGFSHNGKVFTPNGTTGITTAENEDRNQAIQAAELKRWAEQPDRQVGYFHFPAEDRKVGPDRRYREAFEPLIAGAYVTLWPGVLIGTIVRAQVYRHNFGRRFVSLTVRGTNGATYYGQASFDCGQCVNLRKAKGKG